MTSNITICFLKSALIDTSALLNIFTFSGGNSDKPSFEGRDLAYQAMRCPSSFLIERRHNRQHPHEFAKGSRVCTRCWCHICWWVALRGRKERNKKHRGERERKGGGGYLETKGGYEDIERDGQG